jgi:hypothetical protein
LSDSHLWYVKAGEAIDASGDHEISFEEFRELVQQYQLQPRPGERSSLG